MADTGKRLSRLGQSLILILGIAVVVATIIAAHMRAAHDPPVLRQFYYSADDGRTWFIGPARATPFIAQGKEVEQAVLFRCQGQTFVGFLRRWPQAVHDQVNQQLSQNQPRPLPVAEVKWPGATAWVSENYTAGPQRDKSGVSCLEIVLPKCKGGRYALKLVPEGNADE
jgi:hypothetical protein